MVGVILVRIGAGTVRRHSRRPESLELRSYRTVGSDSTRHNFDYDFVRETFK